MHPMEQRPCSFIAVFAVAVETSHPLVHWIMCHLYTSNNGMSSYKMNDPGMNDIPNVSFQIRIICKEHNQQNNIYISYSSADFIRKEDGPLCLQHNIRGKPDLRLWSPTVYCRIPLGHGIKPLTIYPGHYIDMFLVVSLSLFLLLIFLSLWIVSM